MNRPITYLLSVAIFFVLLQACSSASESSLASSKDSDTLSFEDTATVEKKIRRLTELIKFSPDNFDLYYQRSKLYYDAGNTVQAIQDISRVIDLNVEFPEAYHLRGFYAYVQNQDDLAQEYFQQAIHFGSKDPETFYMLGQIAFMKNQYPDADKWYDTAILQDSLQPTYYFAKGFMYRKMNKTEKAIEFFEKALRVQPQFIKALSQLHDIYKFDKNDPTRALAYNDVIMQVDSTHPIGRYNMGYFFMEKGLAVVDDSKAMEMDAYFKIAISEFARAIQADANYADAYYYRGYCFFMLNQYNRAMEDFNRVIELKPYDERPYFLIGSIFENKKDYKSALANYEAALKIDPSFKEAAQAVKEVSSELKKK